MSERGGATLRTAVITFFPMFIATLSLVTSIFNGYLNAKFVDVIQRNVSRGEYLRTCKDVIDAYFQVKAKVTLLRASAERAADGNATLAAHGEAVSAVNRFAALGTYLANLRDDAVRVRYSELSTLLETIVREARNPAADLGKLYGPADRLFASMNDDCVKTAKEAPM